MQYLKKAEETKFVHGGNSCGLCAVFGKVGRE